jgi:hypothetical protein
MSIRKGWMVLSAMPALLIYGVPAARADASADARKAIQAQYDKANAAISKRDEVNMFTIYTPGFICEDIKGKKRTLADLRQQTQMVITQARTISGTTKIISIILKGNNAMVRIAEHSKLVGTDPLTRTDSIILIDSTSDDVWALAKGNWMLTKSKTRAQKSSLNGRQFE